MKFDNFFKSILVIVIFVFSFFLLGSIKSMNLLIEKLPNLKISHTSSFKVGESNERFIVVDSETKKVMLFEISWDGPNPHIKLLTSYSWSK